MNACFDAKLLHICVNIHLSCFILSFVVHCLRAETARGGTDPARMQAGLNSRMGFQK
jgi:hypothetical protein